MDRQAFTVGQLIPNPQLLAMEKSKLVALGYALEAIMGAGGTVVSGLACTPTTSPSLSVVVGRGSIMTTAAIDSVAYSDLGTDTSATIKQGLLQEPGVTLTLTPPSTAGYSQVYLIQAKQSDNDTATTVPFYNASNPAQPYNGPNNSGNATLTLRQSACVVSLKAGAAATTGSQTAPSPDTGNVGLYTITLVNGQSTITAGQIVQLASAPFVPVTLPGVPAAVQAGSWLYAVDTGATGALAAALSPIPAALPDGMEVHVKAGHAAAGGDTFNLNGFGALPIQRRGGATPTAGDWAANDILSLRKLGSVWQLAGIVPSDILALTATVAPITRYITTSQNVVVPAGCTRASVECWGAGGGGGYGSTGQAGSGGGGGGYAQRNLTGLVAGTSIYATIGTGGAGGYGASINGVTGGTTSFGAYLTANGGVGGQGNSTNGTAGGSASGGDINVTGGTGAPGLVLSSNFIAGAGGSSPRGGPGGQQNYAVFDGGRFPGGAGSGGAANGAGGPGANGLIAVTFYP